MAAVKASTTSTTFLPCWLLFVAVVRAALAEEYRSNANITGSVATMVKSGPPGPCGHYKTWFAGDKDKVCYKLLRKKMVGNLLSVRC